MPKDEPTREGVDRGKCAGSAATTGYAGMARHERQNRGETDDWITPKWIIDELGPFDLDPCESELQPWPCAREAYHKPMGLLMPWHGRVWCNPPYGPQVADFLQRCRQHGNAIALVFARTETKAFFANVWGKADAVLFFRGRLRFHRADGSLPGGKYNAGAPSVLIAYGADNAESLRKLDPKRGRCLPA